MGLKIRNLAHPDMKILRRSLLLTALLLVITEVVVRLSG